MVRVTGLCTVEWRVPRTCVLACVLKKKVWNERKERVENKRSWRDTWEGTAQAWKVQTGSVPPPAPWASVCQQRLISRRTRLGLGQEIPDRD